MLLFLYFYIAGAFFMAGLCGYKEDRKNGWGRDKWPKRAWCIIGIFIFTLVGWPILLLWIIIHAIKEDL